LEIVEETSEHLQFDPSSGLTDFDVMGLFPGKITYKLRLTLKTPIMSSSEYERYKMEEFFKKSVKQQPSGYAMLSAGQCKNADLKIVTSDEVEIGAHRNILKGN